MLQSQIVPLALCSMIMPATAQSASINVLRTSGSSAYNANITELSGEATSFDPDGDGALSWNLHFWDTSVNAAPTLGFGA